MEISFIDGRIGGTGERRRREKAEAGGGRAREMKKEAGKCSKRESKRAAR